MKTETQIRGAFDALARCCCALTDEAPPDVLNAMRLQLEIFAWVLDERTFPRFANIDRTLMNVVSVDEQAYRRANEG